LYDSFFYKFILPDIARELLFSLVSPRPLPSSSREEGDYGRTRDLKWTRR
jgi:hypothetical protein